MNYPEEIQFVAAETDAPLATVKGDNALFLIENSQLIQTLLELGENRPSKKVLVVPISGFPTDRRELFANILNGVPVGKYLDTWEHDIEYYPLGGQEEKDLQASVNARYLKGKNSWKTRYKLEQEEREQVIYETMSYLLLSDEAIRQILQFDKEYYKKMMNESLTIDDHIDDLVERHKIWLYLTGKEDKLSEKDWKEQKKYFDELTQKYNSDMEDIVRRRNRAGRHRNRYGRRVGYYYRDDLEEFEDIMDLIHEKYQNQTDSSTYAPEGDNTDSMTPVEYEKYLRAIYFKNKKNSLPLQSYNLNTLYNENERAKKKRFNEVNNSAVIFYNPNKPVNRTRRNNKKNKNKGKNKTRGNNNNGSAW